MDYYKDLLHELKETRIKKEISLQELGRRLGLSGQQVHAIETGKTPLKMPTYFSICRILQVSPRELISGNVTVGETRSLLKSIECLSERDFFIIRNLIMLMQLSQKDL